MKTRAKASFADSEASETGTHEPTTPSLLGSATVDALAAISDPNLRQALEQLGKAIVSGTDESVTEEQAAAKETFQIPLFREAFALPNAILRAALFPALNFKDERPFLKRAPVFAVGSVKVTFTGQQLDQSDLDVLIAIFDTGRYHQLGRQFTFTAHGILKLLGKTTGGADHEWLHSVVVRLRGGTIDIRQPGFPRFFGGFISDGEKDETTGVYTVAINPRLAVLFGFGMWSQVDRAQRAALGRNGTAKVFHGYYSSHAAPGKHRYETLAELAGLRNKQKADVKRKIIKAHDLLKSPSCGLLRDYQADADGILVEKSHTPSQLRHLAKKARGPRKLAKKVSASASTQRRTSARPS